MRALALLLALASCSCAGPSRFEAPPAMVLDTLYFGLSIAKVPGGQVSGKDWAGFVDAELSARFPEGFTFWDAQGQWKGGDGALHREPSKVVQIAHPDTPEMDAKIEALIAAYKVKFSQESVLKVRSRPNVEF